MYVLDGRRRDGSVSVCCIRQFDVSNWSWVWIFIRDFEWRLTWRWLHKDILSNSFCQNWICFHCEFSFSEEICCSSSLEVCVFVWRGISPKAWGFVFEEWWCSYFFILVAYKINHLCSAHSNIFIPWNRYNPQYFSFKLLLPRWYCQLLGLKDWLSNPWVCIYWERYKH